MQKALMLLFIGLAMGATVLLMRQAAKAPPPETQKAQALTPMDENMRETLAGMVRSMHYPCVKAEEAMKDEGFSFSDFEKQIITRYRVVCDQKTLIYYLEYATPAATEQTGQGNEGHALIPQLRAVYSEPLEDIVFKSDDAEFQQRSLYRRHLQSAGFPCDEVTAIVWPQGRFQKPVQNVGYSRKLRIYCSAGRYAYDFDVGETGKIDEIANKANGERLNGGSR